MFEGCFRACFIDVSVRLYDCLRAVLAFRACFIDVSVGLYIASEGTLNSVPCLLVLLEEDGNT